MAKKEQTVTINNQKYALSALSDAAKAQLANLQFVDQKISDLKNQMAVLQAARQHYLGVLVAELPAEK